MRRDLFAVLAVVLALLVAAGPAAAKGDREGSDARPQAAIAGFVLDNGRYRPIEPPGAATQTFAFGIDNRGRIVGSYDDADGRTHGFLRKKNGCYQTIDVPGAYATVATRINDKGQIAGDYFQTKEKFDQGLKRGFLLDRGRFRRIDVPGADSTEAVGLDNRGRVVGETGTLDPLDLYGYLWDDGRIKRIDVPGAAFTGAEEINERGQIAGTYGDDPSGVATRGYLLDRGRFRTFAAPGGPVTQVFGLNNRGQIAGYVAADELLNDAHGFVLAKGVGGPFTPIDFPGAPRTIALGINDGGAIVGAYENPAAATTARGAATDQAGWAPARWMGNWGAPRAAAQAPAATAAEPGASFRPVLPQPTGPHAIGRTTLHLVDQERPDPWKPDRARELMATITYPARRAELYRRSRWFSRALAEDLEASLAQPPTSLTPGSVDLVRARAHSRAEAPVARPPGRRARGWPVVLFSPGGGSSREQNTAQIEDLASRGYVVVSFDHTFEAPVVEFPDGRVARQVPEFLSSDPKVLSVVFKRAVDARVADTRLVLDRLAELDRGRNPDAERRRLPAGLRGALDLSRLGMFGYSYGGYTAGEAMVGDRRIDAGVNLDGSMAHGFGISEDWPYAPGEVVRRGLDRPFMLFGNENHNHARAGDFPAGGDPSWRDFWSNQRGPKVDLTLRRSEHGSFQDLQIALPQIKRALGLAPATFEPLIGTVDPDRSIAAQRAYIAAFFDLYLRHRDTHLLDGPSPAYPEIEFVR